MIEKGINSGELKELSQFLHGYLLATIMCPWGDSVFTHHCGYNIYWRYHSTLPLTL